MTKIFISAGEISGDAHGARLVSEIKHLQSDIQFLGMGHTKMKAAGVDIRADLSKVSTVGFIEPLIYLPKILMTYRKMKRLLKKEKPDLLIPIDYQGYHMLLIKAAKKLKIPVIYYISPQEWQWGNDTGGKKVVNLTDKILSIFKPESQFYNRLGGNAVYIGHPTLDLSTAELSKDQFYKKIDIHKDQKILAIFPGSRPQELKYVAPILLKSAKAIQNDFPNIQIVVSVASSIFESQIKKLSQDLGLKNVIFYTDLSYDLIAYATLSLLTSGTITLEHVCLGTPFIAAYKFSPLSYWVLTHVFKKKFDRVKFFTLPNILMDQETIPEFLQDKANVEALRKKAISLLSDTQEYEHLKHNLLDVKTKMGYPGVVRRAAEEIVGFLK